MLFEHPSAFEQPSASVSTWAHESPSSRLRKLVGEGEEELAWVYLLLVPTFELLWEPIESEQVWGYLQTLILLFFLQVWNQLLMA